MKEDEQTYIYLFYKYKCNEIYFIIKLDLFKIKRYLKNIFFILVKLFLFI